MTTTQPCSVHSEHRPYNHRNDIHHVWPLGHGGPNIPENTVVVCPTGHVNIHLLLDEFLHAHTSKLPYSHTRRFSHEERHLAELGYDRVTRGAM